MTDTDNAKQASLPDLPLCTCAESPREKWIVLAAHLTAMAGLVMMFLSPAVFVVAVVYATATLTCSSCLCCVRYDKGTLHKLIFFGVVAGAFGAATVAAVDIPATFPVLSLLFWLSSSTFLAFPVKLGYTRVPDDDEEEEPSTDEVKSDSQGDEEAPAASANQDLEPQEQGTAPHQGQDNEGVVVKRLIHFGKDGKTKTTETHKIHPDGSKTIQKVTEPIVANTAAPETNDWRLQRQPSEGLHSMQYHS